MQPQSVIFKSLEMAALLSGAKKQFKEHIEPDSSAAMAPRFAVGDVIFVKETWGLFNEDGDTLTALVRGKYTPTGIYQPLFRASRPDIPDGAWRSATILPPKLARAWLRITAVQRINLSELSAADFEAEGCVGYDEKLDPCFKNGFLSMWREKYPPGTRRYPFAWSYTFSAAPL